MIQGAPSSFELGEGDPRNGHVWIPHSGPPTCVDLLCGFAWGFKSSGLRGPEPRRLKGRVIASNGPEIGLSPYKGSKQARLATFSTVPM